MNRFFPLPLVSPPYRYFMSFLCAPHTHTLKLVSFSSPANLQEKLTDFLPKLLDCSTEIKSFHEPPKLPAYSTLELCERYGRVMTSLTLSRTPADGRWAAQTSLTHAFLKAGLSQTYPIFLSLLLLEVLTLSLLVLLILFLRILLYFKANATVRTVWN